MGTWIHAVTATVPGIGVLALLMTLPLRQVDGLVRERQQLRGQAITQVAQDLGDAQILRRVVLAVPTMKRFSTAESQPCQLHGATAVLPIVGGYTMAVLRARRAGVLLGGVLGLIYAMLCAVVAAEQYASLTSVLLLLRIVALMVYFSHLLDGYSLVPNPAEPPRAPAAIMERP